MAWLRKTKLLPGGAPGGHVWHTERDVVEVDDTLAAELLEIKDAGFVSVQAPEPEPDSPSKDADGNADPAAEAGKDAESKPARKAAASKTAAAKTTIQE